MPYIENKRRHQLDHEPCVPETPGELNYRITRIVHRYLFLKGLNYATINEVVGVLECAKLELYRMVAAPYEDTKRATNGPISTLDGYNQGPEPILGSHSRDYVKQDGPCAPRTFDKNGFENTEPGCNPAHYDVPEADEPCPHGYGDGQLPGGGGGDEPCEHAPGGG